MLHELNDYQQNEHDSTQQIHSSSPSEQSPSARRSLDYRRTPEKTRINSDTDLRSKERLNKSSKGFHSSSQQTLDSDYNLQHDSSQSSRLRSHSRQDTRVGPKKQVRVVSPDLSEQSDSPHHDTSPSRGKLVPNKTSEGVSPSAANNEIRTLQYLMRELGEVADT